MNEKKRVHNEYSRCYYCFHCFHPRDFFFNFYFLLFSFIYSFFFLCFCCVNEPLKHCYTLVNLSRRDCMQQMYPYPYVKESKDEMKSEKQWIYAGEDKNPVKFRAIFLVKATLNAETIKLVTASSWRHNTKPSRTALFRGVSYCDEWQMLHYIKNTIQIRLIMRYFIFSYLSSAVLVLVRHWTFLPQR